MLLERIEALHAEVRVLRKEAREDREARELLSDRKAADAERQAKFRKAKKERDSHVTSRDSNVTSEVVSNVLDLENVQEKQKQLIPASRNNHVTSRDAKQPRPTAETWASYSAAYEGRYRAKPVRNKTTNSQMAQFVERIGIEESPLVAAFYVSHNLAWYLQKQHSVGIMLADAEPLRTQWATGKIVTAAGARQADKSQANVDGWTELLKEKPA